LLCCSRKSASYLFVVVRIRFFLTEYETLAITGLPPRLLCKAALIALRCCSGLISASCVVTSTSWRCSRSCFLCLAVCFAGRGKGRGIGVVVFALFPVAAAAA